MPDIARGLEPDRNRFEISGGGSKSQAPGTRCLTFASPPSAPIFRALPPPAGERNWKASTGYPVLDFQFPSRDPEGCGNCGALAPGPGQACIRFETSGGGSKRQAPGIRCLTFASPPSVPILPGFRRPPAFGIKSQAPGTRCLTFGSPRGASRAGETAGSSPGARASPQPFRNFWRRFQKSSTGYPVLDFRPPAFGPDLSRISAPGRRDPKVKHRIPGA